jgi:FixJ family two-component response regulator/AraC-like DNA-binding protein
VRLPGKSGLDVQRELAAANRELPIIFITGHGDIPMTVQAMKGGAIEFLTKPFRDQDLLDAIQFGLSRDSVRQENDKTLAILRERFASLSPRERDIMIQVARGRLSKQIAGDIGTAVATVKVHRSRAMQKMKARSLPELGRMADKLGLVPEEPLHQNAIDRASQNANMEPTGRMRRVLDYISTNIGKEITIAELAQVAALSTFHFVRIFTRTIGISPHRYVSRLRIENAIAEITAARLPLAQVAFNAGFSSQASFTRAFHRATGMTPAEYRRRRRKSTFHVS